MPIVPRSGLDSLADREIIEKENVLHAPFLRAPVQ
jgi:hypothetical protein